MHIVCNIWRIDWTPIRCYHSGSEQTSESSTRLILHVTQISKPGASQSDGFCRIQVTRWVRDGEDAEMQSVYSTSPVDRAFFFELFILWENTEIKFSQILYANILICTYIEGWRNCLLMALLSRWGLELFDRHQYIIKSCNCYSKDNSSSAPIKVLIRWCPWGQAYFQSWSVIRANPECPSSNLRYHHALLVLRHSTEIPETCRCCTWLILEFLGIYFFCW